MGAFALEFYAMTHIGRREPKQYVDLASVPENQWDMHEKLLHWKKWSNGREGRETSPMFGLYRSEAMAKREYGAATVVPLDRDLALEIAAIIQAADFPRLQRSALNWFYIKPRKPAAKAREMGVTLRDLASLVLSGRALVEKALRDKPRFKPPGVPVTAGEPGHNEYGVPWHACNGFIQDAHYWAWVRFKNRGV